MNENNIQERVIKPRSGGLALCLLMLGILVSTGLFILGVISVAQETVVGIGVLLIVLGVIGWFLFPMLMAGLKIVKPNEARVLTLFGKYYGTIKESGFYYVNPFCTSFSPTYNMARAEAVRQAKEAEQQGRVAVVNVNAGKCISLKTQAFDNRRQKVNDVLGNPIIIGTVVIWRVADPTRAVFAVENYSEFLGIQADSTVRNIARLYPYDNFDDDGDDDSREKTLRGSAVEIAESMRQELQRSVESAGLVIEEVRITHLAYSEEIAAAMLQRQQAAAIIAARQKIVDGAVGMVKMAIDKLGEDEIVVLDEERKAAMVSNLLVVLCGNKDAQPVVNSGSIY